MEEQRVEKPNDGFTGTRRKSLALGEHIFHIIDPKTEDKVIYLDEAMLSESQKSFFTRWISAREKTDKQGSEHRFEPNSETKAICNQLLSGDAEFLQTSKKLAENFAKLHNQSMSDGIFFIARATCLDATNEGLVDLIVIMKIDRTQSMSYTYQQGNDGRKVAKLDDIHDSLSTEKNSVQKFAVIAANGSFSWDVIAYDKNVTKEESGMLGMYYKSFLGVTEIASGTTMTRSVFSHVRNWIELEEQQGNISDKLAAATYKSKALEYLMSSTEFNLASYVEFIIRTQNADGGYSVDTQTLDRLTAFLQSKGIHEGVEFRIIQSAIRPKDRRNTIIADKGLQIQFSGTPESNNITVGKKQDNDGYYLITIRSKHIQNHN